MNLTMKQIRIIIEHTPKELKGKQSSLYVTLGYYTRLGANWSYCAGLIKYKGLFIPVVTVFGEIK